MSNSSRPLLSFEWDEEGEKLEIHTNHGGLRQLMASIMELYCMESPDHLHLMTEDWGGDELSAEVQGCNSHIVHHVKIFKWD